MASVKKITMREYNGTDYDTLYPKTIASQVDGVYTKEESISASTRTALGLATNATPDAALAKIAQQLSESGGLKLTKLWENASPTSAFLAQTITIENADKYQFLIFWYKPWRENDYTIYAIVKSGGKTALCYASYYNIVQTYERQFNISGNSFIFSDCMVNGNKNDGNLIPICIQGIA